MTVYAAAACNNNCERPGLVNYGQKPRLSRVIRQAARMAAQMGIPGTAIGMTTAAETRRQARRDERVAQRREERRQQRRADRIQDRPATGNQARIQTMVNEWRQARKDHAAAVKRWRGSAGNRAARQQAAEQVRTLALKIKKLVQDIRAARGQGNLSGLGAAMLDPEDLEAAARQPPTPPPRTTPAPGVGFWPALIAGGFGLAQGILGKRSEDKARKDAEEFRAREARLERAQRARENRLALMMAKAQKAAERITKPLGLALPLPPTPPPAPPAPANVPPWLIPAAVAGGALLLLRR